MAQRSSAREGQALATASGERPRGRLRGILCPRGLADQGGQHGGAGGLTGGGESRWVQAQGTLGHKHGPTSRHPQPPGGFWNLPVGMAVPPYRAGRSPGQGQALSELKTGA